MFRALTRPSSGGTKTSNYMCVCVYAVGPRFTTGLRSRICGCKSNRRKTSNIKWFEIGSWAKQISQIIL